MTPKDNGKDFDELEHAQYDHFIKLFCKKFDYDLYTATGIKGGYVFIFARGPTLGETDVISNLHNDNKIQAVCNAQEMIQKDRLKKTADEMKAVEENEKYPDGKMNEDDEGTATMAIGILNGNVEINFLKPLAWIALPPDKAAQLGLTLINAARKASSNALIGINL